MAADQEEIKIPVFSVLKNGVVLKNIFLNNPQWESKLSSDLCNQEEEEDDPLLIGRHPDCHIVLDHPSISRFHLEIRAKPASSKLSVIDRASVHGTWVSGVKIQPNTPLDLREGDTVKLGASTRVYKLHWVPLSCAFEMEKWLPTLLEENEETHQQENLNEVWAAEIPSAPPIPKSFSSPIGSDNQSSAVMELGEKSPIFCSVVPKLESIGSSFPTEGENRTPEKNGSANEVQSERQHMYPLTSGKKGKSLSLLSRRSKSKSVSSLHIQTERNKENMGERSCIKELEVGNQDNDAALEECKREETLCRVLFENEKENEEEETFVSAKENMSPLSSVSQKSHTRIREALLNASAILTMREELFHLEKETWTPEASASGLKQNRPISADCVEEEDEVHASDKENLTPVVPSHHRFRKSLEELQISSFNAITAFNEEVAVFFSDKENWTPEVPGEQRSNPQHNGEEEKEAFPSDKENTTAETSEIKKSKKPLQRDLQKFDGEEAFPSDKENLTPKVSGVTKTKKKLQRNLLRLDGEEEGFPSDKENLTPEVSGTKKSKKKFQRNLLRLDGEEAAFASDKENITPNASGVKKSKRELTDSQARIEREIMERRKERVPFQFLFESSPSKNGSHLNHAERMVDKERTPCKSLIEKSPSKNHSPLSDARKLEEAAFASDKENITPNASGVKKSKRELTDSQARIEREIMERRKERVPFQFLFESSPSKNGSHLNHAERMVDKERTPCKSLIEKSPSKNHSPLSDARKLESKEKLQSLLKSSPSKNNNPNHVQRTTDKERVPFQSLQSSPLRNSSPVSKAQRTVVDTGNNYSSFIPTQRAEDELSNSSSQSVDQVLQKAGGNKKKWHMVVDTGCFLNEESRKALELLEGLKGTQLIIPRIVIRELDCLKRRESLFRKKTKAASSVLQWIEECMVRSSWWIHVQSSLETMPVASTPPATPRSEFGDGTSDEMGAGASNPMAFSTCGSLMEIVSPTAEDHILDCALLFQRIKDDGQLVLLTDSVTLKIKTMAEGLLCETPTEFRESLVNPYSRRFLWSDSSPRRSTWSCLDDEGLAENYYYQFRDVRKTAKAATESIRGLKLILLHNSHYGNTRHNSHYGNTSLVN